jgi:hypothetical protein
MGENDERIDHFLLLRNNMKALLRTTQKKRKNTSQDIDDAQHLDRMGVVNALPLARKANRQMYCSLAQSSRTSFDVLPLNACIKVKQKLSPCLCMPLAHAYPWRRNKKS